MTQPTEGELKIGTNIGIDVRGQFVGAVIVKIKQGLFRKKYCCRYGTAWSGNVREGFAIKWLPSNKIFINE